jgi:Domain of Unknown Function (DUF1080)
MPKHLSVFWLLCLLASAGQAQAPAVPVPAEGRGGDAPYLVEPGWRPLFNGRDFSGWHGRVCENEPVNRADRPPGCVGHYPFAWIATKGVIWDSNDSARLAAVPAVGDRMLNGRDGKTRDLITDENFGDVELYLEFIVARGSNSGVYLQGHYEVQIFDSSGTVTPTYGDAGGIYEGFSKFTRVANNKFAGSPPRVNAASRAGQWQSYLIWFRAPRFDETGSKTADAEFLRVWHNGVLVQEHVPVDEPTVSALGTPEAPLGPLMLQGDHGFIALRNIYVRPLRPHPEDTRK